MHDIAIELENTPGALAAMGAVFGRAGNSIEVAARSSSMAARSRISWSPMAPWREPLSKRKDCACWRRAMRWTKTDRLT